MHSNENTPNDPNNQDIFGLYLFGLIRMKQAHVYISGFVQGVGFRAYIRSKARKMGVFGWIRNLSDDRVEGIFQPSASGSEGMENVKKLIKICNKGPFFAQVTDIVVDWEEAKEIFSEFKKRETV